LLFFRVWKQTQWNMLFKNFQSGSAILFSIWTVRTSRSMLCEEYTPFEWLGWSTSIPFATESVGIVGLGVAKRVFEQVDDTGDFSLTVTNQNGQEQKRFKWHTIYLQAAPPFLLAVLTGDWKEAEERVGELPFSPKVGQLLRDSLYGWTLLKLDDNMGLALKTLKAAYMTQFSVSENAIKTLIVGKHANWMKLKDALEPFFKAYKVWQSPKKTW